MVVFSLFERCNQECAQCTITPDAEREELHVLLMAARDRYMNEVATGHKSYNRFVRDFIRSHRHVDCQRAVGKNFHEKCLGMAHDILEEMQPKVESLFLQEEVAVRDTDALVVALNTPPPPKYTVSGCESSPNTPSRKFALRPTDDQMSLIAQYANSAHLFYAPVSKEQLRSLFLCEEDFSLRLGSVVGVAMLFDTLAGKGFIDNRWMSIIEKNKLMLGKTSNRHVTASHISTALSQKKSRLKVKPTDLLMLADECEKCEDVKRLRPSET